jgi:hypothetical protein
MMIINTDEEAGSGGSPHQGHAACRVEQVLCRYDVCGMSQEGQICTVQYSTVLFFKIGTILYCTVLYSNVLYSTVP